MDIKDFDFGQSFRKWKIYKIGVLSDISETDSKIFNVFDYLSEITSIEQSEYSSSIETFYFNTRNEFICYTEYDTIYIVDSLYNKIFSLLFGISDVYTLLRKLIVGYLCYIIYPKEICDNFNGLVFDYYLDTINAKQVRNIKTSLNL